MWQHSMLFLHPENQPSFSIFCDSLSELHRHLWEIQKSVETAPRTCRSLSLVVVEHIRTFCPPPPLSSGRPPPHRKISGPKVWVCALFSCFAALSACWNGDFGPEIGQVRKFRSPPENRRKWAPEKGKLLKNWIWGHFSIFRLLFSYFLFLQKKYIYIYIYIYFSFFFVSFFLRPEISVLASGQGSNSCLTDLSWPTSQTKNLTEESLARPTLSLEDLTLRGSVKIQLQQTET